MKIESPRFGTLVVESSQIIEFPRGLAGFEHCRRFSLFHPEGGEPSYFILQSLDDPAIAFHIADPARFGFAYEIVVSDEESADLAIDAAERSVATSTAQLAVAVIVSKETPEQPLRANLNGPLIINLDTRRGLQHVFARLEFDQTSTEPEPAMSRKIFSTSAAPAAIGTYSQAVQAGNTIYLSGQIGLDPVSMQLADGIDAQIVRVFENLKAVAAAAGATLDNAVKVNIYLTDLANFAKVNETMAKYLGQPYPARAAVGVKELPRGALVEADAVLVLG